MTSDATLSAASALVLAAGGGLLLGTAFYGGLWWTVRCAVVSPRPALWFFVSGLLRTGVALAAIAWIGDGRWERLALCLAGMIVARLLVARLTGSAARFVRPPAAARP